MVGEKIAQLKEVLKQSVVFAQFLSLLHITDRYLISPTLVYGPSMLPTLNFTGDVLLIDKLTPFLGKLRPGDVVLVRSPQNPMKMITKRLIGREGDSVSFLIDPASASNGSHSLVVPKGHVWIQGDNIYSSNDSRQMGPVPTALVLGKVFFRVWPPRDFGPLGAYTYQSLCRELVKTGDSFRQHIYTTSRDTIYFKISPHHFLQYPAPVALNVLRSNKVKEVARHY